ncbi:hypothetical protein FQA39_LY13006 [Lamprigera yunnana]|nr:hypothetical protein FQA39_LY13006 [Lamprigera yunnana]
MIQDLLHHLHTQLKDKPTNTFFLMYNYVKGNNENNELPSSSQALALKSVQTLILQKHLEHMKKMVNQGYVDGKLNTVFEKKMDKIKNEAYHQNEETKDSELDYYETYFYNLSDGNDIFYKNDLLVLSMFGTNDQLKTEFIDEMKATNNAFAAGDNDALAESSQKKIGILQEKVRQDLKANGINDSVLNLNF